MPETWQVIDGGESVSLDQLESVATRLIKLAGSVHIWFFYGEMGSGKTSLIKAIGKKLGVSDMMSSPTFAIINEHEGSAGKVIHADLYRLKNEKEIMDIGLDEYFDSGAYCMIEWPERLGRLPVPPHVSIRITTIDSQHRKFEFQHA